MFLSIYSKNKITKKKYIYNKRAIPKISFRIAL
jgi:hypothetical protein